MALINPYIHFNGNAEEAFTFYKSVFGGAFSSLARYKDIASAAYPIPENDGNRVMHIALPIGKSDWLIGSDVLEMMGKVSETDNRNAIFISSGSREEADRLFSGLSAGGTIEMPIADGPLGAYFGMFSDKFGVEWVMEFNPKKEEQN